MKRDHISEQELILLLQNFPVSIGIEREGDQPGQGLYMWWVAGKKGTAATLLDAAKAAATEASALQALIAHQDELSTLRHDNKQLREELRVLLALLKRIVQQKRVVDIVGIMELYQDVIERVEKLVQNTEDANSETGKRDETCLSRASDAGLSLFR